MALYDYNLYIVRELNQGELIPQFLSTGLLQVKDSNEANILGQVDCYFSENINQYSTTRSYYLLVLEFDNEQLEELLNTNGKAFISWLQEVIKQINPAYIFMGGGSYAAYYDVGKISSEKVFTQLDSLIKNGEIAIIHPVMFFSTRLGSGEICSLTGEVPQYQVYNIPERGCLFLLIASNADKTQIEILDPGIIYPELRNFFQQHNSKFISN